MTLRSLVPPLLIMLFPKQRWSHENLSNDGQDLHDKIFTIQLSKLNELPAFKALTSTLLQTVTVIGIPTQLKTYKKPSFYW